MHRPNLVHSGYSGRLRPGTLTDDIPPYQKRRAAPRPDSGLGRLPVAFVRRATWQLFPLGLRLMDRTSRGAVLTPEGQRVVAELNVAHNALVKAVQGAQAPEPRLDDVKLLTTDGIAAYWVMRYLPYLFDMHPDLEMRVFTTTDFEAEQRGHFDLSIHYTQPTNPNLITTRLGTLHFIPYGSEVD